MPDRITSPNDASRVLPGATQATEGSVVRSDHRRASSMPTAPEGLSRRPPVADTRSQGSHRLPRAAQIFSDRNWGVELPDALKSYLRARTNQAGAFLTHFDEAQYARWSGACLGQAHLWMRLNAANPEAAATDRLDALASFEGAVHANIHQLSYSHNREEGFSISRLFGVDSWSSKPGTHDAVYNREMNDLHRIGAHVHSHTNLDLAQLPQAICEIDGYSLVELSLPGRRGERHTWGLFKSSDSEVTIFDANYGEFRVPTAELPAFLQHINEQFRADLGGRIDRISLRPCVVDTHYEGTPAANLCDWLATASSPPGEPATSAAVGGPQRPEEDAEGMGLRHRATVRRTDL